MFYVRPLLFRLLFTFHTFQTEAGKNITHRLRETLISHSIQAGKTQRPFRIMQLFFDLAGINASQ